MQQAAGSDGMVEGLKRARVDSQSYAQETSQFLPSKYICTLHTVLTGMGSWLLAASEVTADGCSRD